jgi:hypothetical protein
MANELTKIAKVANDENRHFVTLNIIPQRVGFLPNVRHSRQSD